LLRRGGIDFQGTVFILATLGFKSWLTVYLLRGRAKSKYILTKRSPAMLKF